MAKKKKKKRVLKIKNIIIILVILVLFGGLFYYFLNMPIKNIYISGNYVISDMDILTLADLDEYPSFVLTSGFGIEKKLLTNEYIESVDINKRLGNVIEINVNENRVIAIDMDGRAILSNGVITNNIYNNQDVPRLISYIYLDKVSEVAIKFSRIDSNILRQISEIEYSPVDVDMDRFLLYMNDGNLVYVTLTKIDKLNKYNDIKDELMDRVGVIYLDSGDYIEVKS